MTVPASWSIPSWIRAPRHLVCALAAGMLVAGSAPDAHAQQCSVQQTANASFGSPTSFAVQSTPQNASIPAAASCSGGLLNVLELIGDSYFRATIGTSLNSFRLKNAAGDLVPYAIFADPDHTVPIAPGTVFNYYTPALLELLGLLGSGSVGNLPLHLSTTPTGPISAGTYTDSFTVQWEWRICRLAVVVCLDYVQGSGTSTITLSMTVTTACQVSSAPDIAFGTAPTLASFPTIDQSISVVCTKGATSQSVGLSTGQHASDGRRRMAGTAGFLAYDIFLQPGNTLWGSAAGSRAPAPGPADGATPQVFSYAARIYVDQSVPGVGQYSDVVVIDITF